MWSHGMSHVITGCESSDHMVWVMWSHGKSHVITWYEACDHMVRVTWLHDMRHVITWYESCDHMVLLVHVWGHDRSIWSWYESYDWLHIIYMYIHYNYDHDHHMMSHVITVQVMRSHGMSHVIRLCLIWDSSNFINSLPSTNTTVKTTVYMTANLKLQ